MTASIRTEPSGILNYEWCPNLKRRVRTITPASTLERGNAYQGAGVPSPQVISRKRAYPATKGT